MVDAVEIEATFDNRFTREFGFPKERPALKVKDYLEDDLKEFIRQSPFLVMATSDTGGNCDASPKGGKPGFVKVLDDRRLLLPDVAGNNLFQSYQNVAANPHVGLIFFIPGIRDTVRVNGRVKIVNKEELERLSIHLEVNNPDDNSKVLQGLLIEVEESYGHCPRALAFSRLWEDERIHKDKSRRAKRV
jgi:PPOX class probable FMN-dependent enzyme